MKARKLRILPRFITRMAAIYQKQTHGKVRYEKVSGSDKLVVLEKTGWIRVKNGLKKGVHKLRIKVKCLGNASYAPYEKTVTVTVRAW